MSRHTIEPAVSLPPAGRRVPAVDCQPAADAGCGHCPECREAETRRFDAALGAGLETIRRAVPEPAPARD
jgi:hypothetical protein